MKTSMLIVGAMATAAVAQDLSGFASLPSCGQTCVTNMVNKADDLGCSANDVACMCLNADFSYGVRDCTDESCSNGSDAGDTQAWAVGICANQGVAITSDGTDIGVSTASDTPVSTGLSTTGDISVTSSVTTTITSSGSVVTSVRPTVVPIQTSSTGVVRTVTTASTTTTERPSETGNNDDNNDDNNNDNNNDDSSAVGTAVPFGLMALAGLVSFLL